MAKTNLAPIFGLIAAAALLIDYVMTVAVSTAAAIAQIQSVIPAAYDVRIEIAFVVDLADHDRQPARPARVGQHLRGPDLPVRRPGPRDRRHRPRQHRRRDRRPGRPSPTPCRSRRRTPLEPIGILLLLKAFAGGSVALTGVEAIANGVPAFKPPEAKNAANTMTAMAILLGILFIGLTVVRGRSTDCARRTRAAPSIVALAAQAAFGDGSLLFVTFAASTALILFLAANTSFNAFPRLAAILAEDGYMPRQFSFRGDRLAYSWGIVLLAGDRLRAALARSAATPTP